MKVQNGHVSDVNAAALSAVSLIILLEHIIMDLSISLPSTLHGLFPRRSILS